MNSTLNNQKEINLNNINNFETKKENKTIPSSRTPLKKIGIQETNHIDIFDKPTNNKNCFQCEEILCLNENEIFDDFLEKLTNFTYNN